MPIKYLKKEDLKPSEKTLDLIRQIAYSYRAITMKEENGMYCLN